MNLVVVNLPDANSVGLLPCPFCGGSAYVDDKLICCGNVGVCPIDVIVRFGDSDALVDNIADAAELWNHRVLPTLTDIH